MILRRAFSLDSAVLLFGSWTIGYWLALAFGQGWYLACAVAAVVLVLTIVGLRSHLVGQPWPDPTKTEAASVVLVLVLVVLWPLQRDLSRAPLTVIAVGALLVRLGVPIVRRSWKKSDTRFVAATSVAAVLTLALALGWTLYVVLLCATAIVAVTARRGSPPSRLWPDADENSRPVSWARPVCSMVLAALGGIVATWHVAGPWWNPDNSYYMNKAAQYAASPTAFRVEDYMFGVGGLIHYPYGNILASYEPAVGVLSAILPLSTESVLFRLVVPLTTAAIPFAVRYAAAGLGVARHSLAGAFASVMVLLMTGSATVALFSQASLGKAVGQFVAVPILIGALGWHVRSPDRLTAVRASFAVVCTVGLSPSLAIASTLVVVPFTAVAVWAVLRRPDRSGAVPSIAVMCAPLVVVLGFSTIALVLQSSAGGEQLETGFKSFPGPLEAWANASLGITRASLLTKAFLAGFAGVFTLLLGPRSSRRAAGLLIVFVFGVVLGPWSFDLLVGDLLDLNYFAWRFFWAVPFIVMTSVAIASLDTRARLGVVTIGALTIALGISGPGETPFALIRPSVVDVSRAPGRWPWQARAAPLNISASTRAVLHHTPRGGRYLSVPRVEELGTALDIDRHATYVRRIYLTPIGTSDAPAAFLFEERMLLARGARGRVKGAEAQAWANALDLVGVDVACLDERSDPGLRREVAQRFPHHRSTPLCEVRWSS